MYPDRTGCRSDRLIVFGSRAVHLCLSAENWPQWRGPTFNGASPETGLPERFSPDENVRGSAGVDAPTD